MNHRQNKVNKSKKQAQSSFDQVLPSLSKWSSKQSDLGVHKNQTWLAILQFNKQQISLMKNKSQRNQRPLLIHHLRTNKNNLFSPSNKNQHRFDEVSTSPSPRKQDLPTPFKKKPKRSPSKLFQAAHIIEQGETFLTKTNSMGIEKFASIEKIARKVDKIQKYHTKFSPRKLRITQEYSITVYGREVAPDLSLIIRQFQNGVFGVTQNNLQNQQMLQLHSKINPSKQHDAEMQSCQYT